MKRLAKIISILLILSMFSTCVYATDNTTPSSVVNPDGGSSEQPVTIILDKPEITSLKAGQKDVTITFTAVDKATKYIVYYNAGGTDSQKETVETTTTVTNLKEETTYNFRVVAICETEDKIIESEPSEIVSVATGLITLAKPTLTLAAYNKGAILKWNSIYGATGYEIWRYYNKKWSKIKTVGAKTLKYKNTGLKLNKKYYYRVRAIRNGRVGAFSSNKSITAKTYLTSSTIKMGYSSGTLWKPAKKYVKGSKTKVNGKGLLPTGTKFTIIERKTVKGTLMVNIKLNKNGKKYWVKSYNVRYGAPYTTKDYTTEVKENFVNKKGYTSKTKYLLFISCYAQKVYVFKGSKGKWDLQKTFKCCTGKASTRTPRGTYKLYKKSAKGWCYKYVSYFKSKNSFHSRPYGSKTMGRPASNGCIRLYDKDAKYIYKSIPKNTTVVSY